MLYSLSKCLYISASATSSTDVVLYVISEEGLKLDPNNAPLKKGLDDVKRALDSRGPPGGDDAGLGAFFKDPNLLGKLASNPKTAPHMADPGFVAKVQGLAKGGNVDFASMLQDKRMLDVIGVAMGIDMVGRRFGDANVSLAYTAVG